MGRRYQVRIWLAEQYRQDGLWFRKTGREGGRTKRFFCSRSQSRLSVNQIFKGFILQRPAESLPRYASPPPPTGHVSHSSSDSSFSSPFRGSGEAREDEHEHERSPSRSRSPPRRSRSRLESRSSTEEPSGTPVPKFKSSAMAI